MSQQRSIDFSWTEDGIQYRFQAGIHKSFRDSMPVRVGSEWRPSGALYKNGQRIGNLKMLKIDGGESVIFILKTSEGDVVIEKYNLR